MKIKRCALIFLFAFTLLFSGVSAVHAEAPAFNLTYDKTSDSFFVRGEAEAGSRVLLLVYSPMYEGAFIEDLYYMDAKNEVNGAYEFCVKMKDECPLGTYTFRVSVNGVEVGSAEDEYVWPNNSDSNIRRFLFDQKMTPGGSISAVAVLKGNMEKEPVILIALYEDNMLKEVKTGSVVRSENGETELRATLSNLPESVSGCTVKAFLLKDLGSIEPMIRGLCTKGN